MKNRYTVHREKASQDQLENMHKLIKENLDKNREEDKKYNIQRKYVLVTGNFLKDTLLLDFQIPDGMILKVFT